MILGALARRVDVEHDHHVGLRERRAELAREQRRARVQVGLEDGHQAPGSSVRAAASVAATSVGWWA